MVLNHGWFFLYFKQKVSHRRTKHSFLFAQVKFLLNGFEGMIEISRFEFKKFLQLGRLLCNKSCRNPNCSLCETVTNAVFIFLGTKFSTLEWKFSFIFFILWLNTIRTILLKLKILYSLVNEGYFWLIPGS